MNVILFIGCKNRAKLFLTKKERSAILSVLAVRTRLELATPCVTGMYSNQLNYRTNLFCCTSFSKASATVLLFFEMTKYFSKKKLISCDFAKFTCQNNEICVIKHIFLPKYLVGIEKSSTFAPCFSWY